MSGTRGFEEFRDEQPALLVRWLAAQGASCPDAEDVAQTALTEVWRRWPGLGNPRGYLYRVAANELAGLWKTRHRQDTAVRGAASRGSQHASGDIPGRLQADLVREQLLALPPRQRAAIAGHIDGYQDQELAGALGMPAATVRSNRRHARAALRALAAGSGRDLRGRLLHQAYAEMRGGNLSPAGSRPVISQSWARSARYQVDADLGILTDHLNPDELVFRRGTSPLRAVVPLAAALADNTGLLIVVADADGRVLWRAGDHSALHRADQDGHSDGACLAEQVIGTGGISVALAARHPVLVRGAEHYRQSQHDLAAAAAPVRHPGDGRLLGALNLTAPLRTAHPAMLQVIDETARQAERHIGHLHRNHPHEPAAPVQR